MSEIRTFSLVTEQGIPMHDTTLCDEHLRSHREEAIMSARDQAELGTIWNGNGIVDTSENHECACIVCGAVGDGLYPKSDWRYEVANGDTVLGYVEWREHQIEAARS